MLREIIALAKQLEEEDEASKVKAAMRKAEKSDMKLAAYRSEDKQSLVDGEAGPDYDDPA